MDKCQQCGGDTAVIKGKPYSYAESGLAVELHGLNQYKCKKCGESSVAIPRIKELHRVIGGIICREKKGILSGDEIRFLRKDLHLKSKDFAMMLGVTPATVSRWEHNKSPMEEAQDRLLRAIYMLYATEQADHVICHGVVDSFRELKRNRTQHEQTPIGLSVPDWTLDRTVEFCSRV